MHSLAHVIPSGVALLLRGAPLSAGKVDFAWKTAVGPAMQRGASVRLEAGTLVVDAGDRHWAREITRSAHLILPRLQLLLGPDVVKGISVRVRADRAGDARPAPGT
jgi:hypothetical protein